MLKPLAAISSLKLVSRTLAFKQYALLAAILFAVTLNGCAHAAKDTPPAEERAATVQPPRCTYATSAIEFTTSQRAISDN